MQTRFPADGCGWVGSADLQLAAPAPPDNLQAQSTQPAFEFKPAAMAQQ
jgi:hypothetical protein